MDAVVSHVHRLLPPSWSATVSREEPTDPGLRPDTILTLGAGDGTSVSFVVEVKQHGRASARDLVDATSQHAALSGHPGIVVTDYANPALRAACLDRGLGYVDSTGWVHLRSDRPALFISQQGTSRAPGLPRGTSAMTRLNGPGAGRVLQALFDAPLPTGVRALAEAARVSPGTVAKVLPVLDHAGAITRTRTGQVVERSRAGLLDRWTQDYDFARSNREVAWLLAPRGIDGVLERLRNLSAHGGPDGPGGCFAATASLAARQLLPPDTLSVTPLALVSLYGSDPTAMAEHLRLRPATRATANVVLARPNDDAVLDGPPPTGGHLRLAPRARVLADLITQGGRFVDEADQLLATMHDQENARRGAPS